MQLDEVVGSGGGGDGGDGGGGGEATISSVEGGASFRRDDFVIFSGGVMDASECSRETCARALLRRSSLAANDCQFSAGQ